MESICLSVRRYCSLEQCIVDGVIVRFLEQLSVFTRTGREPQRQLVWPRGVAVLLASQWYVRKCCGCQVCGRMSMSLVLQALPKLAVGDQCVWSIYRLVEQPAQQLVQYRDQGS